MYLNRPKRAINSVQNAINNNNRIALNKYSYNRHRTSIVEKKRKGTFHPRKKRSIREVESLDTYNQLEMENFDIPSINQTIDIPNFSEIFDPSTLAEILDEANLQNEIDLEMLSSIKDIHNENNLKRKRENDEYHEINQFLDDIFNDIGIDDISDESLFFQEY